MTLFIEFSSHKEANQRLSTRIDYGSISVKTSHPCSLHKANRLLKSNKTPSLSHEMMLNFNHYNQGVATGDGYQLIDSNLNSKLEYLGQDVPTWGIV